MSDKCTISATNGIELNRRNECQYCNGYHKYRDYGICGKPIIDPADPENPFICTRPAGHQGKCVACSPNLKGTGIVAHDLGGVSSNRRAA